MNDFGKLSIPEISSLSFKVFKSSFKTLFLFSCVIYIPVTILMYVLFPDMYTSMVSLASGSQTDTNAFLVNALLMMGISLIYTPLLSAFSTHITDAWLNSKPVSFESIMESTFVNWGKLFITAMLYALISYASFFMFLIPGIYFAISFNFHSSVIVTDKLWGLKALMQSLRYIRGRWWGFFGFTMLLAMLKYLLNYLFEMIAAVIPFGGILPLIVINIVIGALSIYFDIANSVWYLNQRALKIKSEPGIAPENME